MTYRYKIKFTTLDSPALDYGYLNSALWLFDYGYFPRALASAWRRVLQVADEGNP